MSEKEKPEVKETNDILEQSMAQTISERDAAVDELSKALDKIEKLKKELEAAKTLIMEDTKAGLINEVAPRVEVPKSQLALKTIDELVAMKKTLDISKYGFLSGTPMKVDEDTPQHKLKTAHDRYMHRLYGGKK